MAIQIGQQLGSLEITALLGKGGMGEVYRARDTKLKRDVAIKIMPDEFSHDGDRLTRFQREAEVLASLNHPNIAAIYDLQEAEGLRFLVLELVEGETLADRIARGPIPIDEALPIARSICEALEAAHEQGIVHRDLKPANVKITADGKVKVLDFGLAKAMAGTTMATTLSNSPTLLSGSMGGMIVGTAAYMSPEQAKGKRVDRRTDIFALGCVIYEMLTGQQAFQGEDVTQILARVLEREPDWNLLPANVPPQIRKLLRLCVEKDVHKRRRDAGDVRIDIEQALGEPSELAVRPVPTRNRLAWISVAVCLVTIAALAIPAVRHFGEVQPAEPAEIRVEVNTPPTTDPFSFAISPDGRRLVFVASNDGKSQLWVRALDSLAAQPLAGTEGASFPFWSPDSASLAFFADSKLKRIDIVGGVPQFLANAAVGFGGAWNRQGIILFAPTGAGLLSKVPVAGGEPVVVTRSEDGLAAHVFPQFLPDGQHFIYYGLNSQSIYLGSLDGSPSKRLATADAAAAVSPSGFLFFPRQTTLFAQAFDFRKLELAGNAVPVAQQLALPALPAFSATFDIVAYRSVSAAVARQLTWVDRSGKTLGVLGAPDSTDFKSDVELSPDGKRIAVQQTINGNFDIWLIDSTRGVPTRFTFDASIEQQPIWSPDGSRIVFQSGKSGFLNLYWKASSGAGTDEPLLESDQPKVPNDWSADGRFLLYRIIDPKTGMDLWVLPMSGANASPLGRSDPKTSGDRKPFPFLKTPFDERDGQFSPDGKWIAYQSNESGQFEIYVQPFPGPSGKFQISTAGGAQPRWNKNGKEIFYISLDSKMMAAPVKLAPDGQSLERGTPAVLFPVRIAGGPLPSFLKQQYAVSADGQRFLINLASGQGITSPITLIYHWHPPKP